MKRSPWTLVRTDRRFSDAQHRDSGEVIEPPRSRIMWRRRQGRVLSLAPVLLLLLLIAGIVAGCGGRTTTLDQVRETGMLRVAIDPAFPPFEFVDEGGQIVGFDADLATALAEGLGVDVHFVTTGYDALYDALTVGRADIIVSALYPDLSRSAGFAFSRPYFNAGDVLVVPAGSNIAETSDLPGSTIACVFGTTGHMAALAWEAELQPAPTLITVESPVTLTLTLRDSTADAVLVDHVSALMAAANDPELRILSPPVTDEPYVVATRREDADLMKELEQVLDRLEADGTLDTLIELWMHP